MGETECPESEIRRSVRNAAQTKLNRVYCLVYEHLAGNKFLHQTNWVSNLAGIHSSTYTKKNNFYTATYTRAVITFRERNKSAAFALSDTIGWVGISIQPVKTNPT